MTDYIPTTDEIKRGFVSNCLEFSFSGDTTTLEDFRNQFDRWLAAHDAEVYQRGVDSQMYMAMYANALNLGYAKGRADAARIVAREFHYGIGGPLKIARVIDEIRGGGGQ